MPQERGAVVQAARDIGREIVAEVGADIIRGRTNQGAPATPGWWNSWWRSFFAVWLPGMSSATLAAVKGRAVDALKKDQVIAADEIMDKSSEFARFLARLREREPWRVLRFAEVLAEIPDPSDRDKVFLEVFDADPRDWEARIASIASEKSFSTKAGEWVRGKCPDWAAVKRHAQSGWNFTKRHAERGNNYLAGEVAPRIRASRISMEQQLDAIIAKRARKRAKRWF